MATGCYPRLWHSSPKKPEQLAKEALGLCQAAGYPVRRPMHKPQDPIEFPEAQELAEGHAIKLLYPDPEGGPPRELLLSRVDGKIYAMDSECPHEGGRMAEGPLMDGRTVHCPLHLYRFEPGSGKAVQVDCPPVKTFEVEQRDGHTWVWVYGRSS